MTLTIAGQTRELPPEVEAAIMEKARRRGQSAADYLVELAMGDEQSGVAPETAAPKVTAASVRGKYAVLGGGTVDEFMAERRAEGLAEMRAEEAAQATQRRAA